MNRLFVAGGLLFLCSCQPNTSQPEQSTPSETSTPMKEQNLAATATLKSQLDEKKQAFLDKAPAEKIEAYQRGVDGLAESGLLDQALHEGDQAISFTLDNATGKAVSLQTYLNQGPVVLVWYRGGWCPYCNITLHYLQEKLPEFQALGANLIALTPELPDKSLDTQEKNQLEFEVLTDLNNEVARAYGIVFQLPEEVSELYKQSFDLEAYNGNDSDELPLAATYVIDTDGTIRYAFLDADYRNRAEPDEILVALRTLQ